MAHKNNSWWPIRGDRSLVYLEEKKVKTIREVEVLEVMVSDICEKGSVKPRMKNFKSAPIIYDTVRLNAKVAHHVANYFTIPRGQMLSPGINKTFTHTNLTTAGIMSEIKKLTITEVDLKPSRELSETDKENLMKGNAVMLIDQKPYPSFLPIKKWLDGFKTMVDIDLYTFEIFRIEMRWDTEYCPDETFDLVANLYGVRAGNNNPPVMYVKLRIYDHQNNRRNYNDKWYEKKDLPELLGYLGQENEWPIDETMEESAVSVVQKREKNGSER